MKLTLTYAQWHPRLLAHEAQVAEWTKPRLERRKAGRKHPVDDFLFDYYRLTPGKLRQWHPGYLQVMMDVPPEICARYTGSRDYRVDCASGRVQADPDRFARRAAMLRRSITVLTNAATRPATFSCFGMHEWAMVYRSEPARIRHAEEALRLSPAQIASVVEATGLRCTHFDAYRFFTDSAASRQTALTPNDQLTTEQPGCLHFGMDLYRHVYQAGPFLPSELLAACFAHAKAARRLDMRASPYDLASYGLSPIRLETAEGQARYVHEQRELSRQSAELRRETLTALESLMELFSHTR